MSPKRSAPAVVLAATVFLACLVLVAPQTVGGSDDHPSAESAKGVPAKFDHGFYEKVQDLIREGGGAVQQAPKFIPEADFEYVPRSAVRYYHVIIAIDGDGDAAVRRNMASVVDALEAVGARDIVPGGSLPFVTASVPVGEIPGLSPPRRGGPSGRRGDPPSSRRWTRRARPSGPT